MKSIWNLRYHIVVIVFSTMFAYAFWQIHHVDLSGNDSVVDSINNLRQANFKLDQEILKTRHFEHRNHQILHKVVSDIRALPQALKEGVLQKFENNIDIQQHFIQLENTLNTKLKEIEIFQSSHTTLQNTLNQLTTLQKSLSLQERIVVQALLIKMLRNENIEIKNLSEKLQNKEVTALVQNIHLNKKNVDKAVTTVFKIPINEKVDVFLAAYNTNYNQQISQVKHLHFILLITTSLLLFTLLLLSYNRITKTRVLQPLNKISHDLYEAANNLSDASNKIKETSEWLTDHGKQQSTAIENSNTLLNEMTQTTETQWLECTKAKEITDSTNAAIQDSISHSHKMILAIKEMESASYEASTILQNIQEIAKQSKIVGLNATIEAAKSENDIFGVVAQEVSSLAIRSAEALEETSSQILNSQERSRQGTNLTENILLYLNDMNFKIQNLEEKISNMNIYFQKQKDSFQMFGQTVEFIASSLKKNEEFSEENALLAENLHGLSNKLQDNISQMLTLSKKLAG